MVKFVCGKNPTHIFHHPAKLTENTFKEPLVIQDLNLADVKVMGPAVPVSVIERSVCPFCDSREYSEYIESTETKQVENVFIYELTTGPQLGLDKLLAEGYEIVGRSVKLYQLEKCKPKAEATQP